MGNRRFYKIEYLHTLGTREFERLKVTALPSPERLRAGRSKSFSPDRLSPFKMSFFHIATQSLKGRTGVGVMFDSSAIIFYFLP
jgi:hypothetical protein